MIRPTATRIPTWRTLLALVALGGMLLALSSGPAEAATTFTVNKTGDAGDRNPADTMCDSSSLRGNQCTLRVAIEESNDTSGPDTINFKIGGTAGVKTINVGSSGLGALPTITDTVIINGYIQRGARANTKVVGNDAVLKIQLNGTKAGTGADGLLITASRDSTIKGLVINRFDSDGVQISGPDESSNRVAGNFIGTTAGGSGDLGNATDGARIENAPGNTIGGAEPGAGNRIAHNGQDGVFISSGVRNRVLSNAIFSNGELGIDLSPNGVTANDLDPNGPNDDSDTGPNNLQNFPSIGRATKNGSTLTITGSLNSTPLQSFTIQCFLAAPDPSGYGEGRTLVGQTTATTDTGGDDDSFTCTGTVDPLILPQKVTATATNTITGDTSEFSANVAVQ